MEELIPIVGALSLFGWLSVQSYWKSKVRIEELKRENRATSDATGANVSANAQGEIAALRREVQSLRDTTTKFDMSFDASLERLEQRVDRIEGVKASEPAYAARPVADAEPQVLRAGR